MNQPITYEELKVLPFQLLHINKLRIEAMVNQHSKLKVTGILPRESEEGDINTDQYTPIEVYAEKEKRQSIFNGIITKIKVKTFPEYYELELEAKSNSYLMDIEKKKRSFQDKDLSAETLVQTITKQYPMGQWYYVKKKYKLK